MVVWEMPGRSLDATRALLVIGGLAVAAGWAQSRTGDRLFLLAQVGLIAVVAIDGLWSALATARVRVVVTSATSDAVVGQPVTVDVSLTGWRRPVLVRMPSPAGATQVRAELPTVGTLEAVAPGRGVFTGVVVEVASKAPLGLLGMTRRRAVPLPQPLAIGPRPVPCPDAPFPPPDRTGGGAAAVRVGAELVRGVRDHRTGDPLRLVHWPATARTGRLVVKELEDSLELRATLVLVVDLGGGGPAAETAAGQASWIATEALRRGFQVVLATREPQGPVTGPVASPLAVSRRLARAVPGAPAPPPDGERRTITVAVTPAREAT
ncbi:MAG: DUF58 domain-containing protein [Acidimicrobiales bacterium]